MRVLEGLWRSTALRAPLMLVVFAVLAATAGCTGDQGATGDPGAEGETGEQGPVVDTGLPAESCLSCHGPDAVAPAVAVGDLGDAHAVDLDPDGPLTDSGYRRIDVEILSVDVTGSALDLLFHAQSEVPVDVDDLFAADGRLGLARLLDPTEPGTSNQWQTLLRSERFTTAGGVFTPEGGGRYRYRSVFDPTSVPVVSGDTLRLAVQLGADDLPAANAICDFDASLVAANDCTSGTARTRDIVPTAQCNSCHGVTSETQLSYHGDRVLAEYCVVCHNPELGDADMTVMTHKIHAGATLANGYRKWSHVQYTRDLADCTTCHGGGGADEASWYEVPTRAACGSCHDTVDFSNGMGHGSGGQQLDDSQCVLCHPAIDDGSATSLPVQVVHRGVERRRRAADYSRPNDGFSIESLTWDEPTDALHVLFSVSRSGTKLDLETAPEFAPSGGSGRVNLRVAWPTSDYTNEGADASASAPAQPLVYSGTDFDFVTNVGNEVYERVIPVPDAAFDTVTVTMDGYPATDLDDDGAFDDALPVQSDFADVHVGGRNEEAPRRTSVDMTKCNACHDAAGAGLSLHGSNRTSETVACVVCHNADATDVAVRPADTLDTPDGKREESIDFKRMIHSIHAGETLERGFVVYGYRGSMHDYSDVGFIGNLRNCETCHVDASPGDSAYGIEAAAAARASTLDTGAAVADPSDDSNASPIAGVCSSCHDGRAARDHMLLFGASFRALDEDIH